MGTGCADSNQDSIELLVNSAYPDSLFFLKKIFFLFIIFIPGCAGSSSLPASFLQASHYGGLSCGARAGEQYLRCTGSVLAAHRLQYLRLTGFSTCSAQASVLAAHGLSCLLAGGVFPDQGLDRGPLHCKVDHWTTCNLDSLFITTFIFTVHHTPARMGRILTTNPQT